MVWWIPAAMAVAGAVEGDAKSKRNEKKLRAQAEIARWSPWTGLAPHDVSTEDSALHGAMQGGVAGIGMTQNMKGGGAEPDPALTSDAGASSEPYSRPADTSNMSLSPPPAAAQAGASTGPNFRPADVGPQSKMSDAPPHMFDTQEPNMSKETLSPEDAAMKRKYPWAAMKQTL